jgi:hypothetical protein
MANPTDDHYNYALQIIDYLYTYKALVMHFKAPANAAAGLTLNIYDLLEGLTTYITYSQPGSRTPRVQQHIVC